MSLPDLSLRNLALLLAFVGIFSLISINFASAYDEMTIFTNQKTYFLRDTVEIRGEINNPSEKDIVKISVIDSDGLMVMESETKIDQDKRDYNYKFTLLGSLAEGIYTVNSAYGEFSASTSFRLFLSPGNEELFPSAITLDKNSYSWTDTVEIFVNAPSYNRNNQIEYIGFGSESKGNIVIQTGLGKLENYGLIETKHDSGVFHGKITLTGDPKVDVNGNNRQDDASGILSDAYPFDGKLPARNNDVIKIIFSNSDQDVEQTSQIRWIVGKMGWVKSVDDSPRSLLRVVDKDMDLRPETRDYIIVNGRINYDYSDILLRETGLSTGIFEGHLNPKTTSNIVYYDKTIPNSESSISFIKITPRTFFVGESTESPSDPPTWFREATESSNVQIKIPKWVKKTAGWWGDSSISEPEFIHVLQYLIKEQIIVIEDLGNTGKWQDNDNSRWTKGYASGWSKGFITDNEFVKGIQHVVEQGLIHIN